MNVDTSRAAAAIVLVVLVYALIVGVATTTPWRVVPDGLQRRPPWQRDFTADERKREVRYHREIRPPAYARIALGLVITLVLGFTPLGARLVEWVATPAGDGWVWAVLLGGVAVLLVGRLLTLPLSAWSEIVLRRWGLSTRTWGSWAADLGEGLRGLPRADAGAAAGLLLAGPGVSRVMVDLGWCWCGGLRCADVFCVPAGDRTGLQQVRVAACLECSGQRCSIWPLVTRCTSRTSSSPTHRAGRRR